MTTAAAEAQAPVIPGTPADPAGAPPVAGAQTPAAPEAPDTPVVPDPLNVDKPEVPEVPQPPDDVEVVYDPTGDVGLDLALQFVGQRGLGPTHPGIVAAHKGDFTVLEDTLKKMGDKAKGYAGYIAAAKASYAQTQAKGQAVLDAVVAEVGGAVRWNAIRQWVQENGDDNEKRQVNAAFAAGQISAVAMVKHLDTAYRASGQDKSPAASGLRKDAGAGGAASTSTALSPTEYKRELANLSKKYGAAISNRPEFAELTQRRKAYQGN